MGDAACEVAIIIDGIPAAEDYVSWETDGVSSIQRNDEVTSTRSARTKGLTQSPLQSQSADVGLAIQSHASFYRQQSAAMLPPGKAMCHIPQLQEKLKGLCIVKVCNPILHVDI